MTTPQKPDVMRLAEGFEHVDAQRWEELAAGVVNKSRAPEKQLDGAGAVEALTSHLPGGIDVAPIYWRDESTALGLPGSMPFTRGLGPRDPNQAWDVRQLHDDPDAARTREAIVEDLERGASSVWLHVGADGIAASDVEAVLTDVMTDLAPVVVSSVEDQQGAADALVAAWEAKGTEPSKIRGSLGHDPLGAAAALGTEPDLSGLAPAVRLVAERLPAVRAITIDTRVYHDAGATDQDEIALALATGLAYVRHLESEGISPAAAFRAVDFRVAATEDQFSTVAKLRALRRTWARVGEVLEVPQDDRGAWIHAVTSWRMQTVTDPWVNILRDTIACFGAAVGGADAITVLPYDTAIGLPTSFSRRIARNTQSLLASESHVARVADPAGGSWYVESLTDELARAAWTWFGELDGAGGMAAALAAGTVAKRLEASRSERDAALATRKVPLTGTSTFPLAGEATLERIPRRAVERGGLKRRRDGELFERLRERTQASPASLPVLALDLPKEHTPRLTWVGNLLGVAGVTPQVVNVIDAEGISSAVEQVGDAPVVILASSKRGYAAHGAAVVEALRALPNGPRVVMAGRASELEGAETDGQVGEGMNVLDFLTDLLEQLKVPAVTSATNEGAQA